MWVPSHHSLFHQLKLLFIVKAESAWPVGGGLARGWRGVWSRWAGVPAVSDGAASKQPKPLGNLGQLVVSWGEIQSAKHVSIFLSAN